MEPHSHRDMNPRTLMIFRERITDANWNDVLTASDPDIAYDLFLAKFVHIYFSCFPERKFVVPRKSRKPWVDRELLKLLKTRDKTI